MTQRGMIYNVIGKSEALVVWPGNGSGNITILPAFITHELEETFYQ